MFFYLAFVISLPLMYSYNKTMLTVWTGLLVVATLLPCDRKLQPKQCYDFGAWVAQRAVEYFHLKMILVDAEAVRTCGTAIVAIEPHDILPLSYIAFNPVVNALPGHKFWGGVTSFCFFLPFLKHVYTWVAAAPVDKKTIISLIDEQISPIICPGGIQEVILIERDDECVLYLNNRLGFVKLAMQRGVPIIPVFSFGLRKTYDSWLPRHPWIRKLGRKLGFLPLIFFGMWGLPFSPGKPVDYTLVVGEPIKVPRTADPTVEDIRKYHAQYVAALESIFETNKTNCGMGDVTLRIV